MSDGRRSRRALRVLAPLFILVAAFAVARSLLASAPRATRRPPERLARLVEVRPVSLGAATVRVEAMGTVRPSREVELRPRVSGQVVETSSELVPGGRFARGDTVLRIDPADYELAVATRRSELAEAEAALRLEAGNQEIARKEYELLGETVGEEDVDLVLRSPQLETAKAQVARARTALREALLALERTHVTAPFDAIVTERNVNLGSQVDPSTVLARLAGSDEYWVEASVPVSELRWIDVPREPGETGAAVRIFDEAAWGGNVWRRGEVIRSLGDVEPEGRMARLLVSVTDPLGARPSLPDRSEGPAGATGDDPRPGNGGAGADAGEAPEPPGEEAEASADAPEPLPPLLLGVFVRAEIEGTRLERVAVLEPARVHDGRYVWIMNTRDELEIRPVTVAWHGRDRVLVSAGVEEGERLVVSDLPAPVDGMPLRTAGGAGG